MTIYKYRTFQEAREAQWVYRPDKQYYKKLRELFDFLSYLPIPKSPRGVFRYATFREAAEQEIAWKVMTPSPSNNKINE